MSKQNPKKQNAATKRENTIVMIIAAVLAVALVVFATITVVNTIRKDNPSADGTTGGGTTAPTIDAAAEGEKLKNTIALTVGDHQLNAVELNYYYTEIVNQFYSEYYYYILYLGMIDTKKPLNEQYYDEEKKVTWADYFLGVAEDGIKSTYMLCDLAEKEGFTLSKEEQNYLTTMRQSIEDYAKQYKYADVNSYLVDYFGYGADIDSYMAYTERALLADAYYSHYADSLEYTEEQLREFESSKMHQYHSYNFATYYLSTDKFLTGGVEGSDGKVTYTDEQKAAAIEAATAAVESMKNGSCESLEAFNAMILGMEVNSSLTSVSITENKDILYSKVDTLFQEWVCSADRSFGDVTVIAKTTTTGTGDDAVTTINGYYILWFNGINDNQFALKDVRHLLVLFKDKDGKTYNDGVSTFTDEQKAAAKAAAEKLLAEWKAGEMTENSFSQLVIKNSEDPGSAANGGLYQYIYPGQMVKNFQDWCYEEGRQFADTGLVESVYGYHIMFYVGDSDITYRDFMVQNDLRNADLSKWHEDLVSSVEVVEVCLDYCKLNMKLGG